MYALCPRCTATIEDIGQSKFLKCPECGEKIRSRYNDNIGLEREEVEPLPEREEAQALPGNEGLRSLPPGERKQ